MAKLVRIPVVREFPVPVAAAWDWLTDYGEQDGDLAGDIVHGRKVLERAGNRVLLRTHITTPTGKVQERIQEVRLDRASRTWHSDIVEGAGKGSQNDYRLVPTATGCRLEIDYQLTFGTTLQRLILTVGKPLAKRRLHRMWDGYERAMLRDLKVSA